MQVTLADDGKRSVNNVSKNVEPTNRTVVKMTAEQKSRRQRMQELDDKWKVDGYRPTVKEVKEYLHYLYDDHKQEDLLIYRGWDPYPATLDQNAICFAVDRAHAMLVFEENKIYDYVTVAMEDFSPDMLMGNGLNYSKNPFTFHDYIQELAEKFPEDETDGVALVECLAIKHKPQL
jgi:hypothetical protein